MNLIGYGAAALILDDIVATEELHEDAREALLLDSALDEALFESDPDLIEFIRMVREGDTPPLDLAARLMERGIDVEALEASITH